MDNFPPDLIYEILKRSPAKAVERCVAKSEACANVVRLKSFYKDFSRRALNNEHHRALFVTRTEPIADQEDRMWSFRSTSMVKTDETILLCTTRIPLHDGKRNRYMNYSTGLLCCGFGAHPIVFNPTNGRHRVLNLPAACDAIQESKTFIGFNFVSGFKVLAVNKKACHVLTLDTMTWKPIQVNLPQPETASVCINGVIYYAALQTPTRMVLISFNSETEALKIHKIPQEPKLGTFFCEKTINVDGKAGVSFAAGGDMHVVRILENPDTELWSERLIQPSSSIQIDIQHFSPLSFEGITDGEAVFSQDIGSRKVIYSHGVKKSFLKHSSQTLIFWEHVESTMFL